MPLFLAPLGEDRTITIASATKDVKYHLQEIGISAGSRIKVISSVGGNVIVEIMEGRVALDRQLASRIYVG